MYNFKKKNYKINKNKKPDLGLVAPLAMIKKGSYIIKNPNPYLSLVGKGAIIRQ